MTDQPRGLNARLGVRPSRPARSTLLGRPTKLARVAEDLILRFERAVSEPNESTLEDSYALCLDSWIEHGLLHEIPRRGRRHLPSLPFFPSEDQAKWLVNVAPGLYAAVFRDATERSRGSVIRGLLYSFLRSYPIDWEHFEPFAESLGRLLSGCSAKSLSYWKEFCDEFEVLRINGPRLFAEHLLTTPSDVNPALAEARMVGTLSTSEFLRYVQVKMADVGAPASQRGVPTPDFLDRMMEFGEITDPADSSKRDVRFPANRPLLAESLLLPFGSAAGQAVPGISERRDRVKGYLVRHLGDPRIEQNPRWHGVSAKARSILVKWLVSESLETFFQVLRLDPNPRQWKFREAFWRAFLKYQLIDNAWFVLGSGAALHISSNVSPDSYGTWLNYRREARSALLVQISGLTVVDWSFDRSMCLYEEGASRTPVFGRKHYDPEGLFDQADIRVAHLAPDYGYWQKEVLRIIEDQTGLRDVSYHDVMQLP